MRMRIAGAHHGAAVLEDLNVVDGVEPAQFPKLSRPSINDKFYLRALAW